MTACPIESHPWTSPSRPARLTDLAADVVCVGLADGGSLPAELAAAPGAADASGRDEKLTLLRPEAPPRVLVAGLGEESELDAERLRVVAARAAKRAAELDARVARLGRSRAGRGCSRRAVEALVEGSVLAAYSFDRYRSRDDDGPTAGRVGSLTLLVGDAEREPAERPRGAPRSRPRRPTAPATSRTCPPTRSPRRRSPSARRRSPPSTTRSRSRSSIARRSPPRRWGDSSPSRRGPRPSRG